MSSTRSELHQFICEVYERLFRYLYINVTVLTFNNCGNYTLCIVVKETPLLHSHLIIDIKYNSHSGKPNISKTGYLIFHLTITEPILKFNQSYNLCIAEHNWSIIIVGHKIKRFFWLTTTIRKVLTLFKNISFLTT